MSFVPIEMSIVVIGWRCIRTLAGGCSNMVKCRWWMMPEEKAAVIVITDVTDFMVVVLLFDSRTAWLS
jgi:hypothetical protein